VRTSSAKGLTKFKNRGPLPRGALDYKPGEFKGTDRKMKKNGNDLDTTEKEEEERRKDGGWTAGGSKGK